VTVTHLEGMVPEVRNFVRPTEGSAGAKRAGDPTATRVWSGKGSATMQQERS
jgi:hypothetical protein